MRNVGEEFRGCPRHRALDKSHAHGKIIAMSSATHVAIDTSGRLVVPKAIRDEAGIEPGMPLRISVHDGRIEIEPEFAAIRRVEHRGMQVAELVEPWNSLPESVVKGVRDDLRERRKKWL
jgi:AbrB family looped-hinge helix DNA binding protein